MNQSKLSFAEIIELLKAYYGEDGYNDFAYEYGEITPEEAKEYNIPAYKEVDQRGGEGEGDDWWSVKYFPEHDIYIRIVGHYQSHHGLDIYDGWDACREVKPKEKTITVYE